jgi:hypothetical protein
MSARNRSACAASSAARAVSAARSYPPGGAASPAAHPTADAVQVVAASTFAAVRGQTDEASTAADGAYARASGDRPPGQIARDSRTAAATAEASSGSPTRPPANRSEASRAARHPAGSRCHTRRAQATANNRNSRWWLPAGSARTIGSGSEQDSHSVSVTRSRLRRRTIELTGPAGLQPPTRTADQHSNNAEPPDPVPRGSASGRCRTGAGAITSGQTAEITLERSTIP